mmetsp:Transcript_137850/g.428366  ORF Transcript_137850/g.428366 Transcript_137850/m.428366 type:complete len:310 (-) Transcript_137850:615-1544(-)
MTSPAFQVLLWKRSATRSRSSESSLLIKGMLFKHSERATVCTRWTFAGGSAAARSWRLSVSSVTSVTLRTVIFRGSSKKRESSPKQAPLPSCPAVFSLPFATLMMSQTPASTMKSLSPSSPSTTTVRPGAKRQARSRETTAIWWGFVRTELEKRGTLSTFSHISCRTAVTACRSSFSNEACVSATSVVLALALASTRPHDQKQSPGVTDSGRCTSNLERSCRPVRSPSCSATLPLLRTKTVSKRVPLGTMAVQGLKSTSCACARTALKASSERLLSCGTCRSRKTCMEECIWVATSFPSSGSQLARISS